MTDKQREAAKAHFEAMAAWSQAKRDEAAARAAYEEKWSTWGKSLQARDRAERLLTEATAKYEKAMGDGG